MNLIISKSSFGKSSSSSNSPIKRSHAAFEREITGGACSCKFIPCNSTYNLQEPIVIEEEQCECDQQINSPMPRLEENKSSVNEDSFENNDCFVIDESEIESNSPTPRFEHNSNQFTIMLCESKEENEEEAPKIRKISDLKDPDNYVNYIKSNKFFIDLITKQYEIVREFRGDIKEIQKKIKSSSIKHLSLSRQPLDSGSNTDDNENIQYKKTIVLELEDLIFTILDHKVEGVNPNLVFEQRNEEGVMITQYMYMNQSYKPFLLYICKTFEVIIYSRIKSGLLNQLLNQIKSMCPEIIFSAVLGRNSCFNAKLMSGIPIHEKEAEDISTFSNDPLQKFEFTVKNIEKFVKSRGKENLIFIDNCLHSYINYLDMYIPVPKFTGSENFSLFFLKFYLEDYLKGREPIWNDIFDKYSSCD